tara:strand:- start:887 stop:1321 length:435 start_codon:yes stop_codon:yes gene_type:complete
VDDITTILLEQGSLGLFAAFLIYQFFQMNKRLDQRNENFMSQLDKIKESNKEEINQLRDRYDAVINSYNDERTQIRINLAEKITKVENKIETLPFDNLQIQIEAISLGQRANQAILDKGMDLIKQMQEDAKLKEMARKLAKDET